MTHARKIAEARATLATFQARQEDEAARARRQLANGSVVNPAALHDARRRVEDQITMTEALILGLEEAELHMLARIPIVLAEMPVREAELVAATAQKANAQAAIVRIETELSQAYRDLQVVAQNGDTIYFATSKLRREHAELSEAFPDAFEEKVVVQNATR